MQSSSKKLKMKMKNLYIETFFNDNDFYFFQFNYLLTPEMAASKIVTTLHILISYYDYSLKWNSTKN